MKHPVTDQDTHFLIDSLTRVVTNETETKSMLVQYDHNSERFTFEVPRNVDGHDLLDCNLVRVHYINIDKSKRLERSGISTITDTLEICPENDSCVTCSWLIPSDATQLAGSLHFVIQFSCVEGERVLYAWHTAKHTSVYITDGIKSDTKFVAENIDILENWWNRLKGNTVVSLEQTQYSDESNGINVWEATFGDGRKSQMQVRNGSTGLIGSIETVNGSPLHFFTGTTEQYEALPEEQRKNGLLAVINDDTTVADLIQDVKSIKNGSINARGLLRPLIGIGDDYKKQIDMTDLPCGFYHVTVESVADDLHTGALLYYYTDHPMCVSLLKYPTTTGVNGEYFLGINCNEEMDNILKVYRTVTTHNETEYVSTTYKIERAEISVALIVPIDHPIE